MFDRLLIANRGEIVARIARTANRLGIGTVGVYSEPDANALHVDSVDIAIALGGWSAAESYLRGDAIIEAALSTGCSAVHPGYGFLAENADFAQQVIDAGLIFVGPPPDQIRTLGDKAEAKRLAARAGVPTTPIYEVVPGMVPPGVTMPAVVKAAAGGGGRGMRVVREAGELKAAVEAASREAKTAFGDGTVFIEPFIERGRHVEVQIIGDSHGNGVHLGERECSIQRRNQKLIEEAPSVGIDNETRTALHEGAIALGRQVEYESAGTVEFLVGDDRTITFLEVNARIQVEHAVTEAITGIDIVELQLRVAVGEELPMRQEDIRFSGHAIEARIVAEDPAAGWLPSTGEVLAFEFADDLRVDSGVRPGSIVTSEYDSMLAKVIAHGTDRMTARRKLARGLRSARVAGLRTNIASTLAILESDDFVKALTPTAFLDEHPDLLNAPAVEGEDRIALLVAAVIAGDVGAEESPTSFAPPGWRNLRTRGQRQVWSDGFEQSHVELLFDESLITVWLGQWPEPLDDGSLPEDPRRRILVRILDEGEQAMALEVDGVRHRVRVLQIDGTSRSINTSSSRGTATWSRLPDFVVRESHQIGTGPICPLPGTVIDVLVEAGQSVGAGEVLMMVEAMKMEHPITAVADSVVSAVLFGVGDRVDVGDLLVELETP